MKLLRFLGAARLKNAKRSVRVGLDKHERLILSIVDRPQITRNFERLYPCYLPLWNAFQYCSIADLDLSILTYQLMTAETDWRRRLNARVLALVLFECVDDIPGILAKEFQNGIASFPEGKNRLKELQLIRKELATFGKKHRSVLEEVRNIAVAHRDKNADLQLVVIKGLKIEIVCQLSKEFRSLLDKFNGLMSGVFSDLLSKTKELGEG